jgi:hypothetical protein
MIPRVHTSLSISAKRWPHVFPVRPFASRNFQMPTPRSRSISTSWGNMTLGRSRARGSSRRQSPINVQVVQKEDLFVRIINGGMFLLVGEIAPSFLPILRWLRVLCPGYATYWIYRFIQSTKEKANKAYERLAGALGKALESLRTVQDAVGSAGAKASEKLPEYTQKSSDAINGAASHVGSAIKPYWQWIGTEVEKWRK